MARYSPGKISPWEAQQFASQRAVTRQNMLQGRAQIQHQRSRRGIEFRDQIRDMTTDWNRRRESLPTDYIRRGVFNSGIYRGALQDYAQDRQRSFRQAQRGYQFDLEDLTLRQRQLQDQYHLAMRTSRAEEHARRTQIAAQLRSVL